MNPLSPHRAARPETRMTIGGGRARQGGSGEAGFTMVEIAIALGVIGFALVAIIGILPLGLQVQKETRESTIINQEAKYFMDLIKGDVLGVEDLVDFVGVVEVISLADSSVATYVPGTDFVDSRELVGLLVNSNSTAVTRVRAISSPAVNRGSSGADLAFRYELAITMTPAVSVSLDHPDLPELRSRLYDVILDFQWPVLPGGSLGPNKATYRGMLSGVLTNVPPGTDFYYLLP